MASYGLFTVEVIKVTIFEKFKSSIMDLSGTTSGFKRFTSVSAATSIGAIRSSQFVQPVAAASALNINHKSDLRKIGSNVNSLEVLELPLEGIEEVG